MGFPAILRTNASETNAHHSLSHAEAEAILRSFNPHPILQNPYFAGFLASCFSVLRFRSRRPVLVEF